MKTILILVVIFSFLHISRAYSDISISSLDPKQGIAITSQPSSGSFGNSVKDAGDFNGDGYDDVIIGSFGANTNTGAVYVIFGNPKGLSDIDVTSGLTASQGVIIYGANQNHFFGSSVSYAGDINDDGVDDIIIGAEQYSVARGAAYVIYGSKTPPAIIDLSQGLNINQGFAVTGGSSNSYLGISRGDVNNDKIDDVIIGATGALSNRGAAYVIFGRKGTRNNIDLSSTLDPSDGFAVLGVLNGDGLGRSVSSAGDIDGDGIGDLIIGAAGANTMNGVAYIIYGNSNIGTIDLSQGLNYLTEGFSWGGTLISQFGTAVSGIGDFNGDGKVDIVVGAYAENASKGAAYVIFGNDRSSLFNIGLDSIPAIDPYRGIRIGETSHTTNLGVSVSRAGDINLDGIDDIIIGSNKANGDTGSAFIIFGSKTLPSEIIPANGLAPDGGFRVFGESSGDDLGSSVSFAGDLNGDGMPDVIIGAKGVSSGQGAAYLLFSKLICPEKCETCSTTKKCLTCKTGYGLENSKCIECPIKTELINGICVPKKSSLGTATEVANGLFDSGSTASRIFTIGRSLSVGLGLIAKIIQNVRFLDIDYDEETVEVFKTYGTDLFEIPIPDSFYESPETKELPSQYTRYETEPSFLENYWDTIMIMLISLACFLVIKFVQFLTKSQRKDHIFQVALKNIGQTFANFFIIQIYSNLDDVIFFLLLDIQSTRLSSASAGTSLGMGIFFLVIGLALVFFHCWLMGKYQKEKSQGNLERFEEKYGILGTLYEDFKDDNMAKQSFFGILILRCVILILVIMLLRPQWMQATILMLTNLIFLGYFIYYRPFKSRFDEVVQYFCEFTIFVAYLCVLILSIFDASGTEKTSQRNGLGKCIVIAGIVLALGGFLVQVIQIIGAIIGICKFIKNYNQKKLNVKVSPSPTIPTIGFNQNQQNSSGTRISENSSILNHADPRYMTDQLELMAASHTRNKRPTKKVPFASNDLRTSAINYDNSPIRNRRLNQRVQRNQVFSPPLENKMHRESSPRRQLNVDFGPSNEQSPMRNNIRNNMRNNSPEFPTQINNNLEPRRRRIKRAPRERRNLNFSSGFDEDVI